MFSRRINLNNDNIDSFFNLNVLKNNEDIFQDNNTKQKINSKNEDSNNKIIISSEKESSDNDDNHILLSMGKVVSIKNNDSQKDSLIIIKIY